MVRTKAKGAMEIRGLWWYTLTKPTGNKRERPGHENILNSEKGVKTTIAKNGELEAAQINNGNHWEADRYTLRGPQYDGQRENVIS